MDEFPPPCKPNAPPRRFSDRPTVLRPGLVMFTASPMSSRRPISHQTASHPVHTTRMQLSRETTTSPTEPKRRPEGTAPASHPNHPTRVHPSRQTSTPVSLFVGDSIIRNVRSNSAITHSLSGAMVMDMINILPELIDRHADVQNVVVHIGTNDLSYRQSVLLQRNFTRLIKLLKDCGKKAFISGPIPTLGRGVNSFSRLLSLHSWLHAECVQHDVGFIDNFNLFWGRRALFTPDGLHPSRLGASMLLNNISYGTLA